MFRGSSRIARSRLGPLEFLRRVDSRARVSAAMVRETLARAPAAGVASQLGDDLSLVARLVAGGAPTRVYYLSQGGYDTHAGQAGAHASRLGDLGDALHAFIADLARLGELDRVAVLAFSEFGRRVAENGSRGTDHGAAGPCFVVGGGVAPGLHGQAPDLAPTGLLDGDVRPTLDFRAVYSELLRDWLDIEPAPLFGDTWASPGILRV